MPREPLAVSEERDDLLGEASTPSRHEEPGPTRRMGQGGDSGPAATGGGETSRGFEIVTRQRPREKELGNRW